MGGVPGGTCISCRSVELDEYDQGRRCLDCGARFQLSPAGEPVPSLRAWWVLTAVNGAVGLLALLFLATYLMLGHPAIAPLVAVWGLLAVVVDRGRLSAAAARVR